MVRHVVVVYHVLRNIDQVSESMGILDSFGVLVSSVIAAVVMLVFAILSFFITVFIVNIGAGLAGVSPDEGGFVVLAAAVLAGAAIVAGASPMISHSGME